jgi:hypothetical protein
MPEFIVNPRRAPRAPARCRAAVVSRETRFEADTEDIGPRGCQVVSPVLFRKGEAVRVLVVSESIAEPLQAGGQIAWAAAQTPWRVGIAFDEGSLAAAARWFDWLVATRPGLLGWRGVPERIRTDTVAYLGAPPRFLLDFTADEAVLLRAIASGARIDELIGRFRDRWPAMQIALFSLIARQAVTLQRGQAAHPESWKRILDDVEASLAVESLGEGTVAAPVTSEPEPPAAPAPAARGGAATPPPWARYAATATPVPGGPSGLSIAPGWAGGPARDATRIVDLEGAQPADPAAGAAVPSGRPPPVGPAQSPPAAGVAWRRPAGRNADAQAALDRGMAEVRVGNASAAVTFLRIALTLAPGDAEIAQLLGQIAFGGRLADRR